MKQENSQKLCSEKSNQSIFSQRYNEAKLEATLIEQNCEHSLIHAQFLMLFHAT